jgi:peptide/nickel transport system permease protein
MALFFLILRRLALLAPTLFGVSLVGFLLAYVLPGNPALMKAGPMATPQYVAEMQHKMGLDQPNPIQYARYVIPGLAAHDPWAQSRMPMDMMRQG